MSTQIDLQSRIAALGLVDPTDRQEEPERRPAAPLETLEGLRGGFLDNRKGNADTILEAIRQRLADGYGMTDSVVRSKWVFSAPAAPDIIDELAECDFVVTAVGD
ncbi:hypothetical protein GBAR_LOCUS27283 [Geodia barretti]|uniref:UGSC-like domain-containing protein n=1 Tax=Geodia barretti TaxID=519541 RepID=A0AA35TM47_GEOBA|nr:hypothetical protein GBAR_LOCUS27283 [Geodia barretti]